MIFVTFKSKGSVSDRWDISLTRCAAVFLKNISKYNMKMLAHFCSQKLDENRQKWNGCALFPETNLVWRRKTPPLQVTWAPTRFSLISLVCIGVCHIFTLELNIKTLVGSLVFFVEFQISMLIWCQILIAWYLAGYATRDWFLWWHFCFFFCQIPKVFLAQIS